MNQDKIIIKGARENNLKNINVEIPRDKLVVMTGVSGSGKSTLAFETIYAEGQRRYVESLSAYARQFLDTVAKPDVDSIEGLSPAISIDQKTTSHNPRSTVGTVTEINDFLRLLYARVGTPYCISHKTPIESQTIKQMVDKVMEIEDKTRVMILSPVVRREKGTFKDLFEKLRKEGLVRVRIDHQETLLEEVEEVEKNKRHDIEIIVDRLIKTSDSRSRIYDSLEVALKYGKGLAIVVSKDNEWLFSENYACSECGFSIPNLEPRLFSFNAPIGACSVCKGIGVTREVDIDILIPDKDKSIAKGAILYHKNILFSENIEWQEFEYLCHRYNIDMYIPIKLLTKKELNIILNGSPDSFKYVIETKSGNRLHRQGRIEGVKSRIERLYMETNSNYMREFYNMFMAEKVCPHCHGDRLNELALSVKVGDLNIAQLSNLSIDKALQFFNQLELEPMKAEIARLVLKEIKERLSFLVNVGLNYLTLSRNAGSLSGGEAQRIRLATQIGSHLTGVLYVLDEPSIGLHQRDNQRLINTLKAMRDLGNTLIVVEHDEETMLECDYLIDIGPGAGVNGGQIVACGTPYQVMENENSVTGNYLSKRKNIPVPINRRQGNGLELEILGASENNLKEVNVKIPLGKMVVITGVSGSGKSSLVNQVICKNLQAKLTRSKVKGGKCLNILGIDNIDKVIDITQDPIGRTPRSNPATYVSVFDDIRDLFAKTNGARERGYEKGRFSFNVKGGRCEKCQGDGVTKVEMHFLPDVYVPCDVCQGKRYNEETLQIKYKDKNIFDILEMTIDEATQFFSGIPNIHRKFRTLQDVGLGYIKTGQSATTLSGGEAQRVKLGFELQKKSTGKTLYILDEPTTGLHTDDVNKLLNVLNRICDNGDSILIIEHNLDVIKCADHIIDLGPEGGDEGGQIIFEGTPEEIINHPKSYTGLYLKKHLQS